MVIFYHKRGEKARGEGGMRRIAYACMQNECAFTRRHAGTSGGDCFFINSSLALAGARRGGHRRWRSVLAGTSAGSDFIKKFFSLGRLSPRRPPTVEKCTFLLCNRKVPKECTKGAEPTVRPLWTPPLPWGWLKGAESASMRLASGAARSESLYRAFVIVRLCPRSDSPEGF